MSGSKTREIAGLSRARYIRNTADITMLGEIMGGFQLES